jgi:YidC/Oxa1 family membrane protein insertase
MSFIMLFDSWQRFSGKPSMFMPDMYKPVQTVNSNLSTNINSVALDAKSSTTTSMVNAIPKGHSETININTGLYNVGIDTLGGTINSLQLLNYAEKGTTKDQHIPVELFGKQHNYLARSGLVNGPNHTNIFAKVENNNIAQNPLAFSMISTVNNLQLTKTYTFHKDKYSIDVDFNVKNVGAIAVNPELYMELLRDGSTLQDSKFYTTFTGPAIYTNEDKFNKIKFQDLDQKKASYPTSANNGWVSMIQHYFATSWIMEGKNRQFYAENIEPNVYRVGFNTNLGTLPAGASISQKAILFAGPQQEKLLPGIAKDFDLIKDYGWVAMFAKPLFWLLEKIHSFVGNWGWAIILLTLLLKTIFFPLTAASQRSMTKMKDLQPKVAALKEQYKNEPQKMQQEMLAIYRKEKVNPMGGCLPMLVQIPVFIALYFVLLSSVEMRNAPWLGWIKDLATPDPFYILPVLMAISMFIQTKFNPKPADPMQAKIMTFVPLLFSVMFFFFPSGLVLYYVVNNVLSIVQQQYITRVMHKVKSPA